MIIKKASHLRQSARETKDLILRGTTPIHNNSVMRLSGYGQCCLISAPCNGGFSDLSYSLFETNDNPIWLRLLKGEFSVFLLLLRINQQLSETSLQILILFFAFSIFIFLILSDRGSTVQWGMCHYKLMFCALNFKNTINLHYLAYDYFFMV